MLRTEQALDIIFAVLVILAVVFTGQSLGPAQRDVVSQGHQVTSVQGGESGRKEQGRDRDA